jgi:hypothetical protein
MTMMTNKPSAPANRTDLKTWTPEQLEWAAPIWVGKLMNREIQDIQLIRSITPGTQLHLDALKIYNKTKEQLTYWKLISMGTKTYRVLPPSLRTHHRNGSVATHRGTPAKRHTTVGNWDKASGIWD